MTVTNSKNKPSRNDQLRQIQKGTRKHFSSGTVTIAGKTYNMPDDITKPIDADIAASDAATQAHADWLSKVKAEKDSHAALAPVLRLFKKRVISEAGDDQAAQTMLADFGWTAPKKVKKNLATKTAAKTKGEGTRKLRNTMGSKQKKNVKATDAQPAAQANGGNGANANGGGNGAQQPPPKQ